MHSKCSAEKQSRVYTKCDFCVRILWSVFHWKIFLLFTFNHPTQLCPRFLCIMTFMGSTSVISRKPMPSCKSKWNLGSRKRENSSLFLTAFFGRHCQQDFSTYTLHWWKYSTSFFQLCSITICMWTYSTLEVEMHRVRESRKIQKYNRFLYLFKKELRNTKVKTSQTQRCYFVGCQVMGSFQRVISHFRLSCGLHSSISCASMIRVSFGSFGHRIINYFRSLSLLGWPVVKALFLS